MSIITSEVNYKTEVLAAGQNTKGYFSPKKSIILHRGTDGISLTTSLLSLPINTTITPTASTWTITFMHWNLLGRGSANGKHDPHVPPWARRPREGRSGPRAPACRLGGTRCTDLFWSEFCGFRLNPNLGRTALPMAAELPCLHKKAAAMPGEGAGRLCVPCSRVGTPRALRGLGRAWSESTPGSCWADGSALQKSSRFKALPQPMPVFWRFFLTPNT